MNKSGHRYNVQEQQKVYAQEKERIWQSQMKSLSRKDAPELTDEEDERPAAKLRFGSLVTGDTPATVDSAASPSVSHRSGSPEKAGHKVLVLKREVSLANYSPFRC
jgi:transcription initiation factor TFIID subunit 1